MNEFLFPPEESKPDALTQARLEYDEALATLEKCHAEAIEKNDVAQLAMSFTDSARKAVERAKLKLEHAERWAARGGK